MINSFKSFVFALIIAFLTLSLSGCGDTRENIDVRNPAEARDEIFSVEPRTNGTYTIWLQHDDVAAYCATTEELGKAARKALHTRTGILIITYRNLLKTDAQYNSKPFNWSGNPKACIAEGANVMYYVLSIEVLDQGE